jgi:hypothetical protein
MPVKTGLSHAVAAFACLLVSSTFATYVKQYALVETGTRWAGWFVVVVTDGAVEASYGGPLLVGAALSFLWGMAYHARRFDGR